MEKLNSELLKSEVFIQSGLVATLDGKFLYIDTSKHYSADKETGQYLDGKFLDIDKSKYSDGRETGQLVTIVEVSLS